MNVDNLDICAEEVTDGSVNLYKDDVVKDIFKEMVIIGTSINSPPIKKIIHDLKNQLTCYMGVADLIRDKLKKDNFDTTSDYFQNSVEKLKQCFENISSLNEDLLAQLDKVKDKENESNIIVEKSHLFIPKYNQEHLTYLADIFINQDKVANLDITYICDLKDKQYYTKISSSCFNRVFINMFKNSAEALDKKGSRIICCISKLFDSDDKREWILFQIKDNGVGMTEEHLKKIFSDGFTTKNNPGGDRGLGLSSVKEIIDSVDGKILVSSKLGKGTTFRVFIPLV